MWVVPDVVILPLRQQKQEDQKFNASVGYIVKPCYKKKM
jgi:hypothetical protein